MWLFSIWLCRYNAHWNVIVLIGGYFVCFLCFVSFDIFHCYVSLCLQLCTLYSEQRFSISSSKYCIVGLFLLWIKTVALELLLDYFCGLNVVLAAKIIFFNLLLENILFHQHIRNEKFWKSFSTRKWVMKFMEYQRWQNFSQMCFVPLTA